MVGKGVMGGACGLTPPPQAPCLFAYEILAPWHFHALNLFFRLSQYTGKQQNTIENVCAKGNQTWRSQSRLGTSGRAGKGVCVP